MNVVGGGTMHQYPSTDEGPHKPGPEENWQESVVLLWHDPHSKIGGFFRVGHEPNRKDGAVVLWAVVHMPGESFFRCATLPLTAADRLADGFGAGQGALTFRFDGQCKWNLKEKDIELSLVLEDFHPAIDGYIRDGKPGLEGNLHSNHVEVALRVTGTVKAKGKTWQVDGLGMRDHGWGCRDWSSLWGHRWNLGAFDKDNSFCAVTAVLAGGKMIHFGWVVRGDKVIYADRVEIVAHMAHDCVSNVGGRTLMTLTTGEKFEVRSDPVAPAAVFCNHGLICVDTISRLTWGDKVGYGVFETSTNPQAGSHRPTIFDGGIGSDGWHRHGFGL